MPFELSHVAIPVSDMETMRRFYLDTLGFVVTDQEGDDPGEVVFMSASPNEHHQVVLANRGGTTETDAVLGHFAMRVGSIGELKAIHKRLVDADAKELRCVSHGTTWSVYFRDPENTRIEILTDTPWHVAQPCRFEIDLSLPEDELIAKTEAHAKTLRDFRPKSQWRDEHLTRL
jgi:catechol 2,3-dioxygenase